MANTVINQSPLYRDNLVGQPLLFGVTNDVDVATETKVKFVAEVYVDDIWPTVTPTNLIGVFKTTPNNDGTGQWDLRNIIESFCSPDNMATNKSTYKGTLTSDTSPHPLHIVDKWSQSENLAIYFRCVFYLECLGGDPVFPNMVAKKAGTEIYSSYYRCWDGYVKNTDIMNKSNSANPNFSFNYGFSLTPFYIYVVLSKKQQRYLTNMPMVTKCNINDYGTISMFVAWTSFTQIVCNFHNESGTILGTEIVPKDAVNGAYGNFTGQTNQLILHFGCYPGNFQNWSPTFQALVSAGTIQGGYITVQCTTNSLATASESLKININCPDLKGYEPVRLCWLNQYGAWDYWTFTKKSTRKLKAKPTTWSQLATTWNERHNKIEGFRGGKKEFKRHSLENWTINTDYELESYNVIFEELMNSPEVYMLHPHSTADERYADKSSKYVTPVRITDTDWTYKTHANDSLIQYTFKIELSKILRTQQV